MFLHLSVILFTGGVSASVHAGIHTPPPWADTPYPPGSPPTPEQTPPHEQIPAGADTPLAVHAGRYGQQAGGTHPTGMHTCFMKKTYMQVLKCKVQ